MSELFRYRINGVIDTTRNVLENIEQIANAACSWVSYDNMTGEWAVVINKVDTSKRSFNDTNIIGDITLTTTSLNEFYNRVEVSFPHRDIDDAMDAVAFELPAGQRFPNEQDNTLSITLDLVNEPVQAQAIGMIELKQNRQDRVITFQTDFSNIDLQAGDVIDLTNANFNWTNKPFRIVSLAETDSEAGIILDITALEYSDDVYDISDIERFSPAEEAIVTVGSIGRMSAPNITYNVDAGEISVTSQTPASSTGLVESVEFWVYVVPPGEVVGSVDDNTRVYRLLTTVRPESGGGTFAASADVTTIVKETTAKKFLFKARAKNSLALGPMGDYTYVEFPGQAGVGADGVGNLFGLPLWVQNNLTSRGVMISASAGSERYDDLPDTGVNTFVVDSFNFVAPYSGNYICTLIADQNTSGAVGGRGAAFSEPDDIVAVGIQIVDTVTTTLVGSEVSGGSGTQYWTDWAISVPVTLVAGKTYTINLLYRNSTGSNPGTCSITYNWNVYTVG